MKIDWNSTKVQVITFMLGIIITLTSGFGIWAIKRQINWNYSYKTKTTQHIKQLEERIKKSEERIKALEEFHKPDVVYTPYLRFETNLLTENY